MSTLWLPTRVWLLVVNAFTQNYVFTLLPLDDWIFTDISKSALISLCLSWITRLPINHVYIVTVVKSTVKIKDFNFYAFIISFKVTITYLKK